MKIDYLLYLGYCIGGGLLIGAFGATYNFDLGLIIGLGVGWFFLATLAYNMGRTE